MSDNEWNDIMNSDEEFTLESILAEYKGDAYIEGDKKTSKALLDKRADTIITESRTGTLEKTGILQAVEKEGGFFDDILDPFGEHPEAEIETVVEEIRPAAEEKPRTEEAKPAASGKKEKNVKIKGLSALTGKRGKAGKDSAEQGEETTEKPAAAEAEAAEPPKFAPVLLPDSRVSEETEPAEAAPEIAAEAPDTGPVTAEPQETEEYEEEKTKVSVGDFVFNLRVKARERKIAKKEHKEAKKNPLYKAVEEETAVEAPSEENSEETAKAAPAVFPTEYIPYENEIDEDGVIEGMEEDEAEPETEIIPEDLFPEPDYRYTAEKLKSRAKRKDLQAKISIVIALLMAIFTVLAEKGVLGENGRLFTLILFLAQVVVTILTVDITVYGITDIIRLKFGPESLLLVATVFGLLYSGRLLVTGDFAQLPLSAINALALAFTEWSSYRRTLAEYVSLRMASLSESPNVMVGCYQPQQQVTMIGSRLSDSYDGFFNKLYSADISERLYAYYCPILMLLAVIGGALTSKISGNNIIFCIAIIATAGAGFSLDTVYALPFSAAAMALKKQGCALGGWKACTEIAASDGYAVTSGELFPNSGDVVGIECLNNFKPDRVIKYASGLLIDSGSAFAPAFQKLLHKQGVTKVAVSEIEIIEGGFTGKIRSDRVTVGSVACMNLISAGIPAELKLQNAVYLVINGMPAGVFTLDYIPEKPVATALDRMLSCGCLPYLASTDCNVSPIMVSQKYKVSVEDLGYLSLKESYKVTENFDKTPHAALAVMHTDGLSGAGSVLSFVPKVIRAVKASLAVAVLCSAIGVCTLLLLCATAAQSGILVTNILEYLLIVQLVVLLIGRLTVGNR